MNSNKITYVHILFIACLIVFTKQTYAEDTFQPYIYTNYVHDSNIFRVANKSEAISISGDTKQDDKIIGAGAGLRMHLPISRQTLDIEASLLRRKYEYFDFLNHTESTAKETWGWQIGNHLGGTIGHDYNEKLSEYLESNFTSLNLIFILFAYLRNAVTIAE